jgi:hypothetical protein
MWRDFAATAVFLLLALSAHAETYYVDGRSGQDSQAGTSPQTAWKTIEQANARLQPGDTVLVRAGVYPGECIRPARSGTPEARITYAAYEGETPEVTGGKEGALVSLAERSYVTIGGFKLHSPHIHDWPVAISGEGSQHNRIEQCEVTSPQGYALVVIANGASYNEVIGCVIHDVGRGNQQSGDGIALNFGAHHNTVSKNKVYNCCHSQVLIVNNSQHNTISENDLYSTDPAWAGAGVNTALGADENTVVDNRIHDLGHITSIKCAIQVVSSRNLIHHNVIYNVANFGISVQSYKYQGTTQEAKGNLVANNTVYQPGAQGLSVFSKQDCISSGNRFVNNLVVGSPRDWYGENAWIMVFETYHLEKPVEPGTWFGNTFENNLFFHKEAGEKDMVLYSHRGPALTWSLAELEKTYPESFRGNRELAPEFVAREKGDFSLKPASPLIDSGLDVGLPYAGQAPDIGATERKGPVKTSARP